jgi:hypothetical protein
VTVRLGFVVLQPELWVFAASLQTWAGEAAFNPHVDFADATVFTLWVEKLVPFKAFTRFLFIVYWHGLLLVGQAFGQLDRRNGRGVSREARCFVFLQSILFLTSLNANR